MVFAPPWRPPDASSRPRELSLELGGPFAAALAGEADNLVLRAARALAGQAGRAAPTARIDPGEEPAGRGRPRRRLGRCRGGAARPRTGSGGSASDAAELAPLARAPRRRRAGLPRRPPGPHARHRRAPGARAGSAATLPLLLVNPRRPLATAAVFEGLGALPPRPARRRPAARASCGRLLAWLRARANHLEAPARRLLPAIDEVLAALAAPARLRARPDVGQRRHLLRPVRGRTPPRAGRGRARQAHPDWWVAAATTAAS